MLNNSRVVCSRHVYLKKLASKFDENRKRLFLEEAQIPVSCHGLKIPLQP